MPQHWRGETLLHLKTIHNRTFSPTLKMKTLHELVINKLPRNNNLPVSGCGTYVDIYKVNRTTKFSDTTVLGMYVGLLNRILHVYIQRR